MDKIYAAVLIVFITFTSTTVAYRDGARNDSCYGHEVMHVTFGVEATPTECENPCTYTLTVVNKVGSEGSNNIDTYECGETYLLNVNYTRNAFEGFLVQARNVSGAFDRNSSIYGTFLEDSSYLYKPLNCRINALDVSEVFPNSATQRVPVNEQSHVPLYWRAPDPMNDLPINLTFWFTIVQQQQTFFLPIKGPTLVRDDASCNVATTPEPTTSEPTTEEPTTEEPTTQTSTSMIDQTSTIGSDSTTDDGGDRSGDLSTGAVAGIAVAGIVVGIALLVIVIVIVIVAVKKSPGRNKV